MPADEAVQAHLLSLYKGRKPRHFATIHSSDQAGPDPLTGISVWKRAQPQSHWHYVTHGLSLAHAGTARPAGGSGFGFELTFRLLAGRDEAEPPLWPLEFMHNLACYVARTGNSLENGHRMNANGPIAPGSGSQLCAVGFADDPEVLAVECATGKIAFLQLVALSADEERAAERWDTRKLLDVLLTRMPLWITVLHRESMLNIDTIKHSVAQGTARDGSSTGVLYTDVLNIDVQKRVLRKSIIDITLGAQHIAKLIELLPLRLPFERPFVLWGPTWQLHFKLASRNAVKVHGSTLTLHFTPGMIDAFAIIFREGEGNHVLPAFEEITWHIKRTVIRNAQGDIVTVIA